MAEAGKFDQDIYSSGRGDYGHYVEDIGMDDDDDHDDGVGTGGTHPATLAAQRKAAGAVVDQDAEVLKSFQARGGSGMDTSKIADRETDVCARLRLRVAL